MSDKEFDVKARVPLAIRLCCRVGVGALGFEGWSKKLKSSSVKASSNSIPVMLVVTASLPLKEVIVPPAEEVLGKDSISKLKFRLRSSIAKSMLSIAMPR